MKDIDIVEHDERLKNEFRRELVDRGVLNVTLQALDPLHAEAVKPPHVAWREFQGRIGRDASAKLATVPLHSQSTRRSRSKVMWSSVAGAVSAVIVAFLLTVGWQSAIHNIHTHMSGRVSTYATAMGQHSTVTLPDGSTVVLNVASTLEVPTDFGVGSRTVKLNGEALFTVVHKSGKPFTVLAGESKTQVLGTRFMVRRYDSDSTAMVAVQEGRVNVNSIIVNAEEKVVVAHRGVISRETVSAGQFTFASGILTLEGVSLLEAIPELNRWYNADIRIGDPGLENEYIKARFASGSLTDLAEIFELLFNARIVSAGRVLTLYSKGNEVKG